MTPPYVGFCVDCRWCDCTGAHFCEPDCHPGQECAGFRSAGPKLKRVTDAELMDQEMQAIRDGAGCPRCGVEPGLLCREIVSREEMQPLHAERREAWRTDR